MDDTKQNISTPVLLTMNSITESELSEMFEMYKTTYLTANEKL